MPLSQPSPDRLIFSSVHRSNIASKVGEIAYWLLVAAIASSSVYFLYLCGCLLGRFLSHDFAIFRANPLEDTSYLATVLLLLFVSYVIAALPWYFLKSLNLPYLIKNHTLDIKLPDNRCGNLGEISLVGANMFDKLNIFHENKVVKIPLDRVLDVRIAYSEILTFYTIQIFLITTLSVKPILVGDFSCCGSKEKAKVMLHSTVVEVEKIRNFLNLPSKPSYFVESINDGLAAIFTADCRGKQKVVVDTQDIFSFTSTFPYFRKKVWSFDLESSFIIIDSCLFNFKHRKKIDVNEIEVIDVIREFYRIELLFSDWVLLSPRANKILKNLHQDRYSLVLALKDGSSFKCPHNYLRVFSSTNLASIEAYADRLRTHLDLPARVNEERSERELLALN